MMGKVSSQIHTHLAVRVYSYLIMSKKEFNEKYFQDSLTHMHAHDSFAGVCHICCQSGHQPRPGDLHYRYLAGVRSNRGGPSGHHDYHLQPHVHHLHGAGVSAGEEGSVGSPHQLGAGRPFCSELLH